MNKADKRKTKSKKDREEERLIRRRIGSEIKRARQERELTGKQLAEKAGISPAYISKIETGKSSPNLLILTRIADVLDRHMADFMEFHEFDQELVRSLKDTNLGQMDVEEILTLSTPTKKALLEAVEYLLEH